MTGENYKKIPLLNGMVRFTGMKLDNAPPK